MFACMPDLLNAPPWKQKRAGKGASAQRLRMAIPKRAAWGKTEDRKRSE